MKRLFTTFVVVLLAAGFALAQRTITGVVTGEDGEPLSFATVKVKDASVGARADVEGRYTLSLPSGYKTIVISYTGYATQEVEVGVSDAVDVQMTTSNLIQETVVTALGYEANKARIGVAQSTVDGDAMVRSGEVGVINSLAGKSAGINIVQSTGDPGAGSRIQIRGATTITQEVEPLIIVDGVPMYNESEYGNGSNYLGSGGGVTQQSRLNDINPNDIENVEILRGASAAALWGTRAANGVIVITTKKGKNRMAKDFQVNLTSTLAFDQVNREVPLQTRFGQGRDMKYQFVPTGGRSWGDRIAERPGGDDTYNTAGAYFEGDDGTRFYSVANGTNDNVHGGKNSRATYSPYDQFFKTGVTNNNGVSVSGQNDKGSIFLGFNNTNQDGVIKEGSTYNRNTATLNASRNLGQKWTVEGGGTLSLSKSDRIQMGSNLNGLFLGGLRTPADFNSEYYEGTYVDAAGNRFIDRQRAYRNPLGASTGSIYDNPLWMMNNINSTADVNRLIGRLEVRYYPLPGLSFTARGGSDTYTDEREDFFPVLASGENAGGRYTKEKIARKQFNFDVFGRYVKDINDVFGYNVLLGTNLNQRTQDVISNTTRGFVNPLSPPNLDNGTTFDPFSYTEERRIAGIYGTIGLEFWDKVFVNLTARNDWASTLPEGKNSFFYPAVDASWLFRQDPTNSLLSSGKLRAGIGQVGREPDPYLLLNTFFTPTDQSTGYGEGWGPGINPSAYGGAFALNTSAANPNLEPEIKTEWEVGFDLGLLRDRVDLAFTYYQNKVDNAILPVTTPESSGFLSQVANAATIENNGIEIELDVEAIRKKNFGLSIYGNFTRNRNEVTDLSGVDNVFLGGFEDGSSRAVKGHQLGVLWGSRWDRDPSGNLILDENGFPTLAGTSGVIGDPNPDFRAGIGSGLRFGPLNVNILFDASIGGEMWNGTKGALAFFGTAEYTGVETTLSADQANSLNVYLDPRFPAQFTNLITVAERYPYERNDDGSYTVRGEIADFGGGQVFLDEQWYITGPGSGFTGPTEQFVEDASWTRLRELSVSWNFSPAKWGLNAIPNASIGFTGRNLLLFTQYEGNDPDQSLNGPGVNAIGLDYFQNPGTRSFIFNLNITF